MRINRIKFVSELARKDMTLLRLAGLSGVSRVTLSSIKNGKTCREDTAEKLACALDIPVEQLIEKEQTPWDI